MIKLILHLEGAKLAVGSMVSQLDMEVLETDQQEEGVSEICHKDQLDQ